MREMLEEMKAMVDQIYAAEPQKWWGAKAMILHPPASEVAITKFFQSAVGKGLPPSYGHFLGATDGMETAWQRLSFLGSVTARQKPILGIIKYLHEDQRTRFEAYEGKVTPDKIAAWEAKVDRLYLANHKIVATTPDGHRLVYDTGTRDKKGEMELCWWEHGQAAIRMRYRNIVAYLEAALAEVRRYHKKLVGSKTGRRR